MQALQSAFNPGTIGRVMCRTTLEEILQIRRGNPTDPKHAALVAFTLKIIDTKGFVSDGDLEDFKQAGFTNAHAAEISVIIAQITLSNYFNHINDTELDLPAAPPL